MSRWLVAAALAITSAVGISVPASAQEAPDDWTSAICGSLTDWSDGLEELAEDIPSPAGKSPRRAKALLVEFLTSAVDLTDGLVEEISEAGRPDVENGRAIARVFRTGVARAGKLFEKALRDSKTLPTGDRAAFSTRVGRIERSLDRGGRQVQDVFDQARDRYSAPELDEAFNDEPACAKIADS